MPAGINLLNDKKSLVINQKSELNQQQVSYCNSVIKKEILAEWL
jgi:hypothetical protein